jgi:(p)ppGpp synthase/HD superfamily hydrolase
MIYGHKIQKAISIASLAHKEQKRKITGVPYISHPLSAGLILAKTKAPEDVIVAGILHDTIEDTNLTKEFIQKEFGADVARMVNDVTEQDKNLSWDERKKVACEHIEHMQQDSLLVKSADVLDNMLDMIASYKKDGAKIFFNFKASSDKQLSRHQKLISELKRAWKDNPLLLEIEKGLAEFTKIAQS